MRFAPLVLLLLACRRGAPTAPAPTAHAWTPWPDLIDVACAGEVCHVLDTAGLWALTLPKIARDQPVTADLTGVEALGLHGADLALIANCPDVGRCARTLQDPTPLGLPMIEATPTPDEHDHDGQAAMFSRQLTAATRGFGRVGFYRLVVTPEGGRSVLLPGNGATLMHTGAGLKSVRLGLRDTTQPWPATLALHPTGQELYVLAWPDGTVRALDPLTFEPHWTLPVEAPAWGAYIDNAGRYLVGQLADADIVPVPDDRLSPWPEPDGTTDDEILRTRDAPPVTATFIIDLSTKSVVAALPGRLRRTVSLPGPTGAASEARLLVATTEAIQLVTPEDP